MGNANIKTMIMIFGILMSTLMVVLAPPGAEKFWNTMAIASLMIVFWIFEVIPIYVTALFPLLLAVPMGVLDSTTLADSYGNRMVFLFLGGFLLSLALEKWDVHQRIAEMILRAVGTSKTRIILGFLVSTAFLSMWISNTATALMMMPMAVAVIGKLPTKGNSKFSLYLMLSIAYGASIGGMGTLIGSPTNLALAAYLEDSKMIEAKLDFLGWFVIGFPIAIAMIAATYAYFHYLLGDERHTKLDELSVEKKEWNSDQVRVLLIFSGIVLLWIFKPWIESGTGIKYGDEVPAILGAILMFIIPSSHKGKTLLEWDDTKKMAWGILLLFGGGMALAKMMEVNGIIEIVSHAFEKYSDLPLALLILLLVTLAIFATEVMSNLALVQVFVPIVAVFALTLPNTPVLELCIPVTLAASCAFMLPVSTPPNAVVFSSGKVTVSQMVRVGFILNLIGVGVVLGLSLLLL